MYQEPHRSQLQHHISRTLHFTCIKTLPISTSAFNMSDAAFCFPENTHHAIDKSLPPKSVNEFLNMQALAHKDKSDHCSPCSDSLTTWIQARKIGKSTTPIRLTGMVLPRAVSISEAIMPDTDAGTMPAILHFSDTLRKRPRAPKTLCHSGLGRIQR